MYYGDVEEKKFTPYQRQRTIQSTRSRPNRYCEICRRRRVPFQHRVRCNHCLDIVKAVATKLVKPDTGGHRRLRSYKFAFFMIGEIMKDYALTRRGAPPPDGDDVGTGTRMAF